MHVYTHFMYTRIDCCSLIVIDGHISVKNGKLDRFAMAAVRVDKFADIEHLSGMEEEIASVLGAAQVMNLVFGQAAIAPDGQQDSFMVAAVLDAVGCSTEFKHLRRPPFN